MATELQKAIYNDILAKEKLATTAAQRRDLIIESIKRLAAIVLDIGDADVKPQNPETNITEEPK